MERRDTQDIVSGLALVAVGLAFAVGSLDLRLGTLARVGPAFAPLAVSVALMGIGLAIAVTGAMRAPAERRAPFALRPAIVILGGIASFAATIRPAGLVPATILLVLIVTLAEGRVRPLFSATLAAVLATLAYTIFIAALGLPIPAFGRRLMLLLGLG